MKFFDLVKAALPLASCATAATAAVYVNELSLQKDEKDCQAKGHDTMRVEKPFYVPGCGLSTYTRVVPVKKTPTKEAEASSPSP